MPTVRYTVMDGEMVAEKRDGVRRSYVPDAIGSTVALLDSTQTQTDTFSYWPYGEEKSRTGSTPTPFRYGGTLGYYRDSATRSYVRARYPDIKKGRWMTVDPFESRLAPYVYAEDSPVTFGDFTGLITAADCKRKSPGHCFHCLYDLFVSNPPYHYCPKRACAVARKECHSNFQICGPCGANNPPPPPGCSPGAMYRYSEWLRDKCGGPRGADKIAHCWLMCQIGKCFGPLGRIAVCGKMIFAPDPDADDPPAEGAGLGCGVNLLDCLSCCGKKTHGMQCW